VNEEKRRARDLQRLRTAVPLSRVLGPFCKWCGEDRDDGPHLEDASKERPLPPELPPDSHVFQEAALPSPFPMQAVALTFRELDGWVMLEAYDPTSKLEVNLKTRAVMYRQGQAQLVDGAAVALARRACPHVDHQVCCRVVRFTDSPDGSALPAATGFQMEVRVWCSDCGERFLIVGDQLPVGMSPAQPTVDVEGATLLVPLRPLLAGEGWGLDRPGFQVRVR
jgi:hypothetical protein